LCGFDAAIDRADVAPCVLEVAELTERAFARGAGGHSERDKRFDAHVEVKRELLVDVARDLLRRSPGKAEKPAAHHTGSRTLKTASA
jgi:hypothetical protein